MIAVPTFADGIVLPRHRAILDYGQGPYRRRLSLRCWPGRPGLLAGPPQFFSCEVRNRLLFLDMVPSTRTARLVDGLFNRQLSFKNCRLVWWALKPALHDIIGRANSKPLAMQAAAALRVQEGGLSIMIGEQWGEPL